MRRCERRLIWLSLWLCLAATYANEWNTTVCARVRESDNGTSAEAVVTLSAQLSPTLGVKGKGLPRLRNAPSTHIQVYRVKWGQAANTSAGGNANELVIFATAHDSFDSILQKLMEKIPLTSLPGNIRLEASDIFM